MNLERGKHYWKKARAAEFGVFRDSASYFSAARRSILQAQKQVVIVGWDFHTRLELVRGGDADGRPTQLGEVIRAALEENEALEIYILVWDFSMVYALEREWRAFSEILSDPPSRLHFKYDDQLPTGCSHHQKILLIDGVLAFTGGLDLSVWRWDTIKHEIDNRFRIDPEGEYYEPYHDMHCALRGEVCSVIHEICDTRWKRATGGNLPTCDESDDTHIEWPSGIATKTTDVEITFARTYAMWKETPETLEIEKLNLEIIASAENYLYIENQYFSSNRMGEAILELIKKPDGPEIIIVLNNDTEGAMEESTLGKIRDYWFQKFREADKPNRVRTLYPAVHHQGDGGDPVRVYVHAKVAIIDDRIFKTGSANMSNRSMRVDSELDIAMIEEEPTDFIRSVRSTLISGHLGVDTELFEKAVESEGGLIGAIDSLRSNKGKSLLEIPLREVDFVIEQLSREQILDPDEPIDPRQWIQRRVSSDESGNLRKRILVFSGIAGILLLLALAFQFGWGGLTERDKVTEWVKAVQDAPYSPVVLIGLFFLTGLVGFPLNAILGVSVLVFGPWTAFFCAYLGAHASALITFGIGRVFGSSILNRINSESVDRINEKLKHRGFLPMALVRILPIAPFPIVNLVAGGSKLTQTNFHLGTLLGMAPGMLFVALLATQIENVFQDPKWTGFVALAALLLVLGFVAWLVLRGISGASSASRPNSPSPQVP